MATSARFTRNCSPQACERSAKSAVTALVRRASGDYWASQASSQRIPAGIATEPPASTMLATGKAQ